ncbi:hypothetical protein [Streptomyces sp. NPDC093984]|uniref:hypothetical protein n=1 Tax=Streptomyces sp. NPDC093984 TaxID=3366052 RepID=UPI00380A38BE
MTAWIAAARGFFTIGGELTRPLQRTPVVLQIPGTSTVAHGEDDVAAATVELSDEDFEALATAV